MANILRWVLCKSTESANRKINYEADMSTLVRLIEERFALLSSFNRAIKYQEFYPRLSKNILDNIDKREGQARASYYVMR